MRTWNQRRPSAAVAAVATVAWLVVFAGGRPCSAGVVGNAPAGSALPVPRDGPLVMPTPAAAHLRTRRQTATSAAVAIHGVCRTQLPPVQRTPLCDALVSNTVCNASHSESVWRMAMVGYMGMYTCQQMLDTLGADGLLNRCAAVVGLFAVPKNCPCTCANLARAHLDMCTRMNATSLAAACSNADGSAVTDMTRLFAKAQFFNRDINSWDTRKAQAMARLFYKAAAFNQQLNGMPPLTRCVGRVNPPCLFSLRG